MSSPVNSFLRSSSLSADPLPSHRPSGSDAEAGFHVTDRVLDRKWEIAHMPAPALQMFVNWMSSRSRSIGATWALIMGELPPDDKNRFRKGFENELAAGACLLGIGVALHAELIHTPPVLSRMVRLLTIDMLHDFSSVLQVVQDTLEAKEDPHLMHYEGNWWAKFNPGTDVPVGDLGQLYDWWIVQRTVCPKPLMLPQFTRFNLSYMTANELEEVRRAIKQMRREVDLDIEATQQEITRIVLCITKVKLHVMSLKRQEGEAIEAEAAKLNVRAASGKDVPSDPGEGGLSDPAS